MTSGQGQAGKAQKLPEPSALIGRDMALLEAFREAREPEAREALRRELCTLCAHMPEEPNVDQMEECNRHHCGLLDPGKSTEEWQWLMTAVEAVMLPMPFPIDRRVLHQINVHVGESGCVTVVLIPYPDGTTGWELAAVTLRGVMHRVLLRFCSMMGAHPIVDRLTEQDNATFIEWQRQLKKQQVQTLGRLGKNQLEIVRATNVKRSTVQRWLKEKPIAS
jgi:hypothetical protein